MANASYVQATKASLGAIIKKPALTDKYLSKPPFRFLHDIVTAVIRQTGFLKGLYTDQELNPDNIKDRDAKIAFLQKLSDCVQFANEKGLAIKPSKIIAGQEPERTNELLQAIAEAVNTKADSDAAVQKVLNGEKPEFKAGSDSAGSNKENRVSTKGESSGERKSEKGSSQGADAKQRGAQRPSGTRDQASRRDGSKERSKEKDDGKAAPRTATVSKGRSGSKERMGQEETDSKRRSSVGKGVASKAAGARAKDPAGGSGSNRRGSKETSSKDKTKPSTSRDASRDRRSSVSKESSKDKRSDESKSRAKHSSDTKHLAQTEEPTVDLHTADSPDSALLNGSMDADTRISPDPPDPTNMLSAPPARIDSHSAGPTPNHASRNDNENDLDAARPAHSAVARPTTAMRRPGTSMGGRPGTASGQRPTTARPAPPRVRKVTEQTPEPMDSRQGSAGAAAVQSLIISESRKTGSAGSAHSAIPDDEADSYIVEEPLLGTETEENQFAVNGDQTDSGIDADAMDSQEHGGLVRKILETKKELEANIAAELDGPAPDGAGPTVTVFDEKERERTIKEARKLQGSIQALTRASHPLARIMDSMQEDVDSMLKELDQWRTEYHSNWTLLREQAGAASKDLEPLETKLKELTAQTNEQQDAIAAAKANILGNEEKMATMMTNLAQK